MTHRLFTLAALPAALISLSAHAFILISEQDFLARGGDLTQADRSYPRVFAQLTARSEAHPFFAVGLLEHNNGYCTATWLGNDEHQHNAWFLTAAHCVPASTAGRNRYEASFTDWSGNIMATGVGTAYAHPDYLSRGLGQSGSAADVAVIRLPRVGPLLDAQLLPVEPPLLYDENREQTRSIDWVGYGQWGIGTAGPKQNWQPDIPSRRIWSRTMLAAFNETGKSGVVSGSPRYPGGYWARSAPGDSGSAWWQQQQGIWTIVATTFGGKGPVSVGPRISRYAGWIQAQFPLARRYTEFITVKRAHPVRIPDSWHTLQRGSVAYTVPAPGRGPVSLQTQTPVNITRFTVPLMTPENREYPITLRAAHTTPCGTIEMNKINDCTRQGESALKISYHAEDNPGLAQGVYQGDFMIEARGTQDSAYLQPVRLRADITVD
jgi:hypothetical protein